MCKAIEETKTYRYFYLSRPPDIGCQPDGWLNREGGLPKKIYEVNGVFQNSFGAIEYPSLLPFEVSDKYDLMPADPKENALLHLWLWSDRNHADANLRISRYMSQMTLEELREAAKENASAYFILVAQGISVKPGDPA